MPLVTRVPVPWGLIGFRPGLPRTALQAALASALIGTVASAGSNTASDPLLEHIWRGVGQAEKRHQSGCGELTETRVSPLLTRPLVRHGSFCAAGLDRFRVEFERPERARVIYNRGILNATSGSRTEVLEVGGPVSRAQHYFSGPRARENLQHDFRITASETADRYALVLVPVSGRIAGRVKRVAVELGKDNFLPRRIQVEGANGVNSIFELRVETLDTALDESAFEVYRP
jgi:outer membrane lipoprotein-sorting protein